MTKPVTTKASSDPVVKDTRRATCILHSSEEKIRTVLSGLRGEDSIAELCRKEGIAQSHYYIRPEPPRVDERALERVAEIPATVDRCTGLHHRSGGQLQGNKEG